MKNGCVLVSANSSSSSPRLLLFISLLVLALKGHNLVTKLPPIFLCNVEMIGSLGNRARKDWEAKG